MFIQNVLENIYYLIKVEFIFLKKFNMIEIGEKVEDIVYFKLVNSDYLIDIK
jgi:hypothetical protein